MTSKNEGEFNVSPEVFNDFNALRNHIVQGIKAPIHRFKLKGDMMTKHLIKRNRYIKGEILEYTVIYVLHFLGVFERNTTIGLGVDFWNDRFLIEAKHWEKRYSRGYSLTPARFLSEVLARFLDSDPNHKKLWILITSAGINERTLKLLQAHKIQVITVKVITDDQTLQQTKQIILKQLRGVLHIHTLEDFGVVGVGAVEGAVGEVVDADGVDDAYVSFMKEDLVTCLSLMRGFCPQNPDSPNVEVDFPYLAYDLDRMQWKNMLIAKFMIQSEEIHLIIKGLVHHSG